MHFEFWTEVDYMIRLESPYLDVDNAEEVRSNSVGPDLIILRLSFPGRLR
jgi:hypothetical protein